MMLPLIDDLDMFGNEDRFDRIRIPIVIPRKAQWKTSTQPSLKPGKVHSGDKLRLGPNTTTALGL
eukprot:1340732-Amorphochlora_amoeboformis.AAC.1